MQLEEIKTTYKGVEITYNERKNKWFFDLNGKERSAESLANAKTAIDAPIPKEKKTFKPTQALLKDHGVKGLSVVTVTSEAEEGRYYFTKDDKGERRKYRFEDLFIYGPANLSIAGKIWVLREEIQAAYAKIERLQEDLAPFKGLDEVTK